MLDAANPLHSEQQILAAGLVVVAVVAVDLAANLATRPSRAVNVDVGSVGANRLDQLVKFAGRDTALVGKVSDVHRRNRARDLRRRRRTGLRSRRTVAEVGAKEHADGTSHRLLSKVDMGLLDGAFEILVSQFPINA